MQHKNRAVIVIVIAALVIPFCSIRLVQMIGRHDNKEIVFFATCIFFWLLLGLAMGWRLIKMNKAKQKNNI